MTTSAEFNDLFVQELTVDYTQAGGGQCLGYSSAGGLGDCECRRQDAGGHCNGM